MLAALLSLFLLPLSHPFYHQVHPWQFALRIPSLNLFSRRIAHHIVDNESHLTLILSHPMLKNHPDFRINVISQPPLLHLHLTEQCKNCDPLRFSHTLFLSEHVARASVHARRTDSERIVLSLEKLSTRIEKRVENCMNSTGPFECLGNLIRSTCGSNNMRSALFQVLSCDHQCTTKLLKQCMAPQGFFTWSIRMFSTILFSVVALIIVVSFLWGFSFVFIAFPSQVLAVLYLFRKCSVSISGRFAKWLEEEAGHLPS